MTKAEEFANLAKSQKTTLFNRIYYFFLIRKLRRAAKQHYSGYEFYDTTFNPYIKKRLKEEKFKVKKRKNKKGKQYTSVEWIYKKKNKGSDTTID